MFLSIVNKLANTLVLSLLLASHATAEHQLIQHKITSKFSKQTVELHVHLPQDYDDKQQYIPLYTTAGDRRLKSMLEQIDWMSHVSFGPIPKMIVIQLPYIPAPNEVPMKDVQASGNNTEITIDVLEQEVLPLIKKHYSILPFRILEGYSTNANLPLNIMADAPQLFNAYISINPAWVLDKNNLMARLKNQLTSDQLKYRSAYVSLGSFHQNSAAFSEFKHLSEQVNTKLSLVLDKQNDINYYTAPMMLFPKALELVFSDRNPKDLSSLAKGGIAAVDNYYQKLAKKYGYSLSPINTLHDLSDYYGQHKQPKKQVQTLKHILKLKPDNVFYRIMLANVFFDNKQQAQYQHYIDEALALAKAANNDEAIEYIQHIISENS
ncbi:MAG: alpha/beta hydrolase-fold protein [Psychrobium sp.]